MEQLVDLMIGETKLKPHQLLFRQVVIFIITCFFCLSCNSVTNTQVSELQVSFTQSPKEIITYKIGEYEIIHDSTKLTEDMQSLWVGNKLYLPQNKIYHKTEQEKANLFIQIDPFLQAMLLYASLKEKDPELVNQTSMFSLHTQGVVTLKKTDCLAVSSFPDIIKTSMVICSE